MNYLTEGEVEQSLPLAIPLGVVVKVPCLFHNINDPIMKGVAVSLPNVVEPPILTCGYCGSNNCGSLYGDPVCHELD